jgi:hypothetical protein
VVDTLSLSVFGTLYDTPRLVDENVDAVVTSYNRFLTEHAEDLARNQTPRAILGELAQKAMDKAVKEARVESHKTKQAEIATTTNDYERRVATQRGEDTRAREDLIEKYEGLKEKAHEWCKKYFGTIHAY